MTSDVSMKSKYYKEYKRIKKYASENGLIFDLINDKLYVLSDIAFWKIVYLKEWNGYILFHGNSIPTDLNIMKYEDAEYHFQRDVKLSDNIMNLIVYIKKHDDYRAKILTNVENMPRKTKKQKNDYQKMKQKEKDYNTARILQLINAVGMAAELNLDISA